MKERNGCADLTGADLTGTDLRFADLRGATLIPAGLRGADLPGTDVRRADLVGADFAGASWGVDVYYDEQPTWGDFRPPVSLGRACEDIDAGGS